MSESVKNLCKEYRKIPACDGGAAFHRPKRFAIYEADLGGSIGEAINTKSKPEASPTKKKQTINQERNSPIA
jgi:hypothetical protein